MACCKNAWSKIVCTVIIITCSTYPALLILILVGNDDFLSDPRAYVAKDTKLEILIYCSVVFNILWVILSIVLLIFLTIIENQTYSMKATQKLIKVYLVWIIFGFLTFIPDIVSIVMHAINLFDDKLSKKETAGALFMIEISSRFIILIILWITMIVTSRSLHKTLSSSGFVGQYQNPMPQAPDYQNREPQIGQIVPLKPPKPVLKPSRVPHLEENNIDRVRDWYKHYENGNNNMNNTANYNNSPDIVPKYLPRLNGNINPAFDGHHTYEQVQSPSNRMSNPPPRQHHMPGSNTNVMVNGVPSGTLRRQLPWSYMPNGGELPQRYNKKPPVPPSDASSHSNYAPYVPPPDYTGTPNKIQRQEFNHPNWNQYL